MSDPQHRRPLGRLRRRGGALLGALLAPLRGGESAVGPTAPPAATDPGPGPRRGVAAAAATAGAGAAAQTARTVPAEDRSDAAVVALAMAAELRGDWALAVTQWQFLAALTNPASARIRVDAPPDPETARKMFAQAVEGLRRARFALALEIHGRGPWRDFAELVARGLEALPDQRALKTERAILNAVRLYVQDALAQDGAPRVPPPKAGPLRRVALCLDLLDPDAVTGLHALALCRGLLEHDAGLEMHLVLTGEHLAVPVPLLPLGLDPAGLDPASTRPDAVDQLVVPFRAALNPDAAARFHLHRLRNPGLEGLVRTCRQITALAPDVIVHAGGHAGMFPAESRAVRHCLFDSHASVLVHIRADDQVDERLDLILAGGPHDIIGPTGRDSPPGGAGGATRGTTRAATAGRVALRILPRLPPGEPGAVDPDASGAPTPAGGALAYDGFDESGDIVSALAGLRMDLALRQLDPGALTTLLSILDARPGLVWHFIGAADPAGTLRACPPLAARAEAGQVVLHPVLAPADFAARVARAVLFLHLPGFVGGARGAGIARRAGVPVLTFRHSDLSGCQPPETVFAPGDAAGCAALARSLLTSAAARAHILDLQAARADQLQQGWAGSLHDALAEAMTLARARLSAPAADGAHAGGTRRKGAAD